MIIKKAILHIMDFNSDVCIFSAQEMDFTNSEVSTFLEKHLERIQNDDGQKHGEFNNDSEFLQDIKNYKSESISFVELSKNIASNIYDQITLSEKLDSTDLLVVDYTTDEQDYIALLLLGNKAEYTHQVFNDDDVIHNEIIKHYAILPNVSQKASAYAIVNCNDFKIDFVDKRRSINGKSVYVLPEKILQCTSVVSAKEAVKIVNKITTQIAEDNGTNPTLAVTKAKSFLVENAEVAPWFSPAELGKQVFSDSTYMQSEFEAKIEEANLPKEVKLEKSVAVKTSKNHKIKTDTGIEINVPAEYFENSKYIEFINNEDGTISIELKNIGKIINK